MPGKWGVLKTEQKTIQHRHAKMARSAAPTTALPDPTHPFARWAGVTVVGLWAVGAQSFPEPLSKLVALLSPGIGYMVGHGLDRFIRWLDARSSHKERQRKLTAIDLAVDRLNREKVEALNTGAAASVIEFIDNLLAEAIRTRVKIVATPVTSENR